VFNGDGTARSVAQKEICQTDPEPGGVNHDPREIWEPGSGVAVEALALAGLNGAISPPSASRSSTYRND
jgi:glycerol kinase